MPSSLRVFTARGTLVRRYIVHIGCFSTVQPENTRAILSVCFSRAARASRESVHSAKSNLTSWTSLRSAKSLPKWFLRAVSTAKEPAARAECPVLILTNKQMSGQGTVSFLLKVFWAEVL